MNCLLRKSKLTNILNYLEPNIRKVEIKFKKDEYIPSKAEIYYIP